MWTDRGWGGRRPGVRAAGTVLVGLVCWSSGAALPAAADVFGVAHRSGRVQGPENTLEVMHLTMSLGNLPWLETDSWLSADGVPMLHHDRDLCRTTNIEDFGYDCENPSNNPLGRLPEVRDFTEAELKLLDVGEWFGPEWAGTRMPTLEEALLLLENTGFRLLVQIKTVGQPAIIKDILERNDIPLETIIIWARGFGFDDWQPVIPGIAQITGQFPVSSVDDALLAQRAAAGDLGICVLSPDLTQELVDLVHSYGLLLYVIPSGAGGVPLFAQVGFGVDGLHIADELNWQSQLAGLPCIDRTDNDGDGGYDFDGVDLDFDRVIDLPPDPQCSSRVDVSEIPQCQDGVDNDGDGYVDLADPDCSSPDDVSEEATPPLQVSVPSSSFVGRTLLVVLLALLAIAGRFTGGMRTPR